MVMWVGCSALGWAASEDLTVKSPSQARRSSSGRVSTQESRRLTPLAEQFLREAKARLDAQQSKERVRERSRLREEAQRIAVEFSQEKLKRQEARDREAKRQLQLAREREIKFLYQKALSLYQHGAYREAIQKLQQMALIDPNHALVKVGERLMAHAELKHFQQKLRVGVASRPAPQGGSVSELEQALTQKRMELETTLKYAKVALQERKYDQAMKLLTTVLEQDPSNREAQQLSEHAQLGKLDEERDRVATQVHEDEHAMINDVLKAQILPPTPEGLSMSAQLLAGGTVDPALSAKLQQPVSFDFTEVALSDVLQFLADTVNVSIIPSPQLDLKSQHVTLKAKDLPLENAIKFLTKSLSLAYRVEQDAVIISTDEEFSHEPMQTRIFFLRNGLGPFSLESAALEPNAALSMESIRSLIDQTIPKPSGSKFIVDPRSGALIMTNTEENLRFLEKLLSQLDITPVQILIEARFMELTVSELEQLGLESVLTGDVALTKQLDPKTDTQSPGQQITSGGGFKFPALAREGEGLNVTLQGVLTGTQFESVLHWLEESKKSKTLSAPRVTTLNNESATIRVVEEFNYPTRYEVSLIQFDINGDGDFDDAGETEYANVPKDFKKRDIGILLNVIPSVGKDLKTITLILTPEVSQFSQFRDLGGGVTVPEFTSSQLTTSVVIQDGQTVVLGGLMKDSTSEQITKVPVLGDLPLVGGMFRQKEQTSTRKNLLIFITARVLASRGPTI